MMMNEEGKPSPFDVVGNDEPIVPTVTLRDETIFVSDLAERLHELERLLPEHDATSPKGKLDRAAMVAEIEAIKEVAKRLKGRGNGGGDGTSGYPDMLIRDDHFVEHTRFLAEDVFGWLNGIPNIIEIDWEATAENLRVDYKSINIKGVLYWFLQPPYQLPEEIYKFSEANREDPAAFRQPTLFKVL